MKKVITQSEIRKIINSNNTEQLKEYLKIKKDQDVFNILLNYAEKMLDNFDNAYIRVIYKILGFLEEISYQEETNLMSKCSIILDLRERLIERIKEVDKKNRQADKKIIFFKEIVNRLENLEINITYNLKSPLILANYNIVKYIIFDLKNLNYSKNLIRNNSHLINAFNMNSENILHLITDEYIKGIEVHAKGGRSYNLFYFDEVLEEILKTEKIKKDDEVVERIIQRITDLDKTRDKSGSEITRATYWYKHLIKKLDNINYEDDLETLNNMYSVNFYFKNDIVHEGKQKGKAINNTKYSKQNDFIITIDDITAYEKDDAISIKMLEPDLYELKIYIADPNKLYSKDSLVMKEARKRGETLYLENKAVGMFPEELIKNYLSLDENKNRFAREYTINITSAGIIEDFKIAKKIISIDKSYTYNEVNEYIKNAPDEKTEKLLEDLITLKNVINKKYINDKIVTQIDPLMTKSENLIETYMIFLNNKIAEFFSSRGIPFVYRYHPQSLELNKNDVNIRKLPENNRKEYRKMIKSLEKTSLSAKYSIDKKSHDGLTLDYYSHSTSPLRRYADILVNECEDNFYFSRLSDRETDLFLEYLKGEVEYTNDRIMGLEKYLCEYEKAKIRSRIK